MGTPIVFISGYGDPEYIEAAKEIAPFGYVMKPFDEREVHAFLEIALSRKKLELELEKYHKQLEQTNLGLKNEVAARKQTETELRESRKLYRDIFEKNNAMKWLVDPSSGKIIKVDPLSRPISTKFKLPKYFRYLDLIDLNFEFLCQICNDNYTPRFVATINILPYNKLSVPFNC